MSTRTRTRTLTLRLGIGLALLLLWLGPRPSQVLAAEPTQADQVAWSALNVVPAGPLGPDGAIHFQAQASYTLRSAPGGFVTIFVFENDSSTSSLHSPAIQPVSIGTGVAKLDLVYQPHPGVQTITLFVGLFQDPQTLLTWVATNAVNLNEWEAKVAFVRAMDDQQAKQYESAVSDLSTALQLAPQIGNFYYWRADSESHLGSYDGAIADYTQALTLMPRDRPSLLGRGIAELWSGADAAAISDLSAVIDNGATADQWSAWAFRARGIARADLGQTETAVADYQAYLHLAPTAPDRGQVEDWIARLDNPVSG